jgi:hypothetical protein
MRAIHVNADLFIVQKESQELWKKKTKQIKQAGKQIKDKGRMKNICETQDFKPFSGKMYN